MIPVAGLGLGRITGTIEPCWFPIVGYEWRLGFPMRTCSRLSTLERVPESVFTELDPFSGLPMANHCLSWHFVHSTSFSARKVRLRLPQARHATRSANLARPFCFKRVGWGLVTVRSRPTTWTGDSAPAFLLIRSSGNLPVSTKSQRTRKSTTRFKVSSSTPEVFSRASADSHLSSGRAAQTVSRNTD